MGQITLQTIGGINRLRQKGGVSREVLYDLLNGYITSDNSAVSRSGTVTDATLPAGTKGLCAFDGGLVVFASSDPGTMPDGYTCEILTHPTAPGTALFDIHFAKPMLGFIYVAAEFVDGSVFHYWLQAWSEWQAETVYNLGDIVQPSVPNGFAYRANRLNPPEAVWAPNVARAIGDRVEPTETNGFAYEVTDVTGASPKSGTTEPTWPTEDGATVIEDTDLNAPSAGGVGTNDPTGTELPPDLVDRYGTGMAGTLARLARR